MKDNVKIFIATHKETIIPQKRGYIPIQVGASLHEKLDYIGDDTGDNISQKNANYCELTALYWIWKNVRADIVGLVHYRRYFFEKIYQTKLESILSEERIIGTLKKYDVITPKADYIYKYNVQEQYADKHNNEDFEKCKQVIKEKTPEYLNAFETISKQKYYYPYNMFIMSKDLFDNYAEWLFKILFELEQRIDIKDYSDYNKRVYGFLSERLFNVWLEKNKELKCKEFYVNNIEEKPIKANLENNIKKIILTIGGK